MKSPPTLLTSKPLVNILFIMLTPFHKNPFINERKTASNGTIRSILETNLFLKLLYYNGCDLYCASTVTQHKKIGTHT